MKTVGRLKEGNLLLAGEVDERSPSVKGMKVRYIRDWTSGSTANTYNHWCEIQALDKSGTNVALNKTVTAIADNNNNLPIIVDGDTATTTYAVNYNGNNAWVIVDLEGHYDLKEVKVWHYYGDGRTYYDTKTEVSPDGVSWYVIFDSAVSGTYAESSAGKTHVVSIGGLVSYYPMDRNDAFGEIGANLYYDNKTWATTDFVDGKKYKLSETGNFSTVAMEAMVYLESTPSERYTVLQSNHQSGGIYLSIDSNLKVSVYNHLKVSNGYHASNTQLQLNTWHKVAHINTPTETIIMVDGVVDRVISNAYDSGVTYLTINDVLIGAESSSRHFQGKIKNIRMSTEDIRPSTNTNTTLQPFGGGIAVEEGTTNLIPDLGGSTYNTDRVYSGDRSQTTVVEIGGKKWLEFDGADNSLRIGSVSVNASTTYTWSFLIYSKVDFSLQITHWDGNGYGTTHHDIKVGIQRVTKTFTTESDSTYDILHLYPPSGDKTYFADFQLEQKSFATSYVDGSRNASTLEIPSSIGSGDFTLSFKANNVIDEVVRQDKTWLSISNSDTTSYINIFHGYGLDFYIGDNYNRAHYRKADTPTYNIGDNLMFFISRVGVTLYIKIYKDGKLWYETSQADSTYFGFSIDKIRLGRGFGNQDSNGRLSNCAFLNTSIYNRVLSSKEMYNLANNKMQITKDGNLLSQTKEKPNGIPSDAKYFPLGDGGLDEHRITTPREDTLAYENGVAWAGTGTTNLSDVNSLGGWTNSGTTIRTADVSDLARLYDNVHVHRLEATAKDTSGNVSGNIEVGSTSASLSTTYSASVYCWIDSIEDTDSNTVWLREYYNGGNRNIGTLNYNGITQLRYMPKKRWFKLELDGATTRADLNPLTLKIDFYFGGLGKIYFTAPQIEQRVCVTPFVNGSRPYTRLNFTGTDLTPNSWQEFTLFMWVKYKQTGVWRLSGAWDRFYFGINPSDQMSFAWYGYHGSGDTTMGQSNVYGNYINLNEWTMIGVSVRNNAFIDLYQDGARTLNHTTPFELNGSGVDFELNSINTASTSYPLNAYVKDLTFVNRALTPDEMSEIYKTQMREKDQLQIQGRVIEESL